MRSKVIDEKTVGEELVNKVRKIVSRIRRRHTFIQTQQDLIDEEKKELTGISKGIFEEDLDASVPEVYGNHEYHTTGGTVRVNFRVSSGSYTEINGQPAPSYLKGELGPENYGKLFDETKTIEVSATQAEMSQQALSKPNLFSVKLKDNITVPELMSLVQTHPSLLNLTITDPVAYAQEYPQNVKETVAVRIKNKFLDLLGDIDGKTLVQARDTLKDLVLKNLLPAILVGNASQSKAKSKKSKK